MSREDDYDNITYYSVSLKCGFEDFNEMTMKLFNIPISEEEWEGDCLEKFTDEQVNILSKFCTKDLKRIKKLLRK